MRRNEGVYSIDFLRQKNGIPIIKRTKRIVWVVDHRNSGNYIEYSFDFGSLERKSVVGGKTETGKKVPVGTSGDSFTLQIEISPEQIAVRDAQGRELDRYHRPDRNETVGRFGFKGDVWLAIKKAP